MSWDDLDFYSNDPLVRYNARQAAKGRSQIPDPNDICKKQKEEGEKDDHKEREETS